MNQIEKKWNVNDTEIEFDLDDVETFEKYESAFDQMAEEEKTIRKDGKMSVFVKDYCNLYYHLFANLFGADIADSLTNKRYHMARWEEVYESFLYFVSDQVRQINERRSEITKPSKNRQQRRAVQKGK